MGFCVYCCTLRLVELGEPLAITLYPYLTLLPSCCPVQATALGVVGDSVAQRLERRWNPGQRYELKRTVHAGILNMIIGVCVKKK